MTQLLRGKMHAFGIWSKAWQPTTKEHKRSTRVTDGFVSNVSYDACLCHRARRYGSRNAIRITTEMQISAHDTMAGRGESDWRECIFSRELVDLLMHQSFAFPFTSFFALSRNSLRSIFPIALFGISSMNATPPLSCL